MRLARRPDLARVVRWWQVCQDAPTLGQAIGLRPRGVEPGHDLFKQIQGHGVR